ncbi:hypothetical protein Tco_0809440 [Tanacetum coccineum]
MRDLWSQDNHCKKNVFWKDSFRVRKAQNFSEGRSVKSGRKESANESGRSSSHVSIVLGFISNEFLDQDVNLVTFDRNSLAVSGNVISLEQGVGSDNYGQQPNMGSSSMGKGFQEYYEIEDLGKLKPKADIRIFVSYAPAKKVFQIYNKRTRIITETILVDFDELIAMASEKFSSGPGP